MGVLQVFQVEDQLLSEQKAVMPAQCSHLKAIRTLRLDCFSEMKLFPPQVLFIEQSAALLMAPALVTPLSNHGMCRCRSLQRSEVSRKSVLGDSWPCLGKPSTCVLAP